MEFNDKTCLYSFQEKLSKVLHYIKRFGGIMNKYDIEISNKISCFSINYGIIEGNNTILFIKVGQNGSIYGYDNKYLKIAKYMHQKFGCTVICASNPYDGKTNLLEFDMNFIDTYCKKFKSYNIYYMGISNGAVIGANWGHLYPQIIKMLLINPPLFINWHKIKSGLSHLKETSATIIIGELDPSFKFAGMINLINNNKLHLITLSNVDHNFTNNLSDFVLLPEQYLFGL